MIHRQIFAATCLSMAMAVAQAADVAWTTWTSHDAGAFTLDGQQIEVAFATSNAHARVTNYPSWTPTATFADGAQVDAGPVAANGIMRLIGGSSALNTVTFSTPVVDPVVAIWSLGQSGVPASFVFQDASPVLVAGGRSAEYGGSSLVVDGHIVSGREGNGTVQFLGTFSQLTWTNPQAENWYGFSVGAATAVPEPHMGWLMLAGMWPVLIGLRRRCPGRG